MYREYDPKDITARLLAMIGEPYEPPDGCMRFLRRALWEFGVNIQGNGAILRDSRLFKKVEKPELGTVVVFKNLILYQDVYLHYEPGFHVGLMLDRRFAIQSSTATFGVARIEIARLPWASGVKGFYRPKILCG